MQRVHIEIDRKRDVLRLRHSAVVSSWIGVIFLGAGLAGLYSCMLAFTSDDSAERFYAPISAGIGVVCAFAGLYQLSGRSGVDLARQGGTVTRWTKVLGRGKREPPHALADHDRVVMLRYFQFSRVSPAAKPNYKYRLQLRSSADEARIVDLAGRLGEGEALEHATTLSEFLAMPIVEMKGMAEGIVR